MDSGLPFKDRFFTELRNRGFSEKTIRTYKYALQELEKFGKIPFSVSEAIELRDVLVNKGLSAKAVNTYIAAYATYLDFLILVGYRNVNPFKNKWIRVKEEKRMPVSLTKEEIKTAFSEIPRKFLIYFRIMLNAGLRVDEVSNLTADNFICKKEMVNSKEITRYYIRVMGKGKKEREALLLDPEIYKEVKEKGIEKVKANTLINIAWRVKMKTGVFNFHCHALRATYITELLNLGFPLAKVKEYAGHEKLSTTSKYIDTSKLYEIKEINAKPLDL